jgi:hypothetical protein
MPHSIVKMVISTKGAKMGLTRGSCVRDKKYVQNFCGLSPGIPPLELQDGGRVGNIEMHFWETSFENPSWMELVASDIGRIESSGPIPTILRLSLW